MTQYGFFIDLSRCIGCNACVIACKQWHDIEPGPAKWIRVYQWEKGAFPGIEVHTLPIMCLHCQEPACVEACPNRAIRKEEKYGAVLIDSTRCTGERKCFAACPYGAPQYAADTPGEKMSKCNMCIDRLEQGLSPICVLSCSMRALEFGPLEELEKKYGRINRVDGLSRASCSVGCPAGVDAGGYIRLIAEGRPDEALELFRETTPFAGVLGRVCSHPCEVECQRGTFDEAVSICSLKRYMADAEYESKESVSPAPRPILHPGSKVAVIGAGPAGLSAAYDLRRLGYPVTVFESAPEAGGLMRYGIPEYRLPKNILKHEIDYIEGQGVEIRTGTPVKDPAAFLREGYAAVFAAAGAWQSRKLNVEGEDSRGVVYALDFLKQVNSGSSEMTSPAGKRVVVIGGGSVAMDAARTALRLKAREVRVVCLECRDLTSTDRMPAQGVEIAGAEAEGAVIQGSRGISRITTFQGRVTGVETMVCLAVRDAEGKFAPRYNRRALSLIEADMVIIAAGQTVDQSAFTAGFEYTGGTVSVDPVTLETGINGIFAGGDMALGAADIISAIAAGKQAAVSIDRYLTGTGLREGRQPQAKSVKEKPLNHRQCSLISRPAGSEGAAGEPSDTGQAGYPEESAAISDDLAVRQAQLCLQCGMTVPSVVFKAEDPKKQIVPWDAEKALALWQKRHPDSGEILPDVFENVRDITDVPSGTYLRDRLHLKPKDVEEMMTYTTDDE